MKRSLKSFLVVAVLSMVLFVVLSVKRVPADHEAVRISRDGDVTVMGPGIRILLPGYRDFITYPTGERTYRSPESGTHEILTQEGETMQVAFSLTVSIPKRFLGRVTESVREQLSSVNVSVTAMSLEFWGGGETGAGYPETVNVSERPPRKLVVVGVDGGDWLNIKPLVDAGKLPNFKKLIDDGATGPLRSEEPILSPLLWTTMATGKYPEDHGILNFTIVDPETGAKAPITRHYRQVDAWWNMLGDYGRSVAVAGWLATDPAETVNGVMVTDRVGYLAFAPSGEEGTVAPGSVHPAERADEIGDRVVRVRDVPFEEVERFMHLTRAEFEAHRDVEFDPKDSINAQLLLYATTRTYESIAHHLLESDRPDVMAVYFELVDATSHLFMLHSPPRMADVPEAEYEKFKDAVEQAYVTQDEILGRFMDALDDETVLMVISDHGFKAGESRLRNRPEIWAGNAAKWHRLNGIVAFYGRGIKRGFEIRGATILDVTPTILALQGLPRAADMPGKIIAQAFDAGLQQQLNPNTVATLEREREHELGPKTAGAASEEAMKKLEALGYLTPDNADAHNNLGQRYQQRGEFHKAIEEYKKAIAMRPDFYGAYNNIAVCYGKLQRYDEAEAALLKTIDIKPDDFYAMNNLAVMNVERRQLDRAIEYARMCVATEPGYVNGRITLGSALAMSGDLDGAEREFREALRLEPENRSAAVNLERLEQARRLEN
jgi:predicted AlkP superfamily phosphohydrolase/phosphomutase/Flp pilus assembly protein TadD